MDKNPFIGQMDRKIQVCELVKTRNSTGEQEVSQNVIANPFAFMNEVSGGEDVEGKIRHLINRTYTVRYNAALLVNTIELVVIDGNQKFEVYHAKEIGRKKHIILMVKDYE